VVSKYFLYLRKYKGFTYFPLTLIMQGGVRYFLPLESQPAHGQIKTEKILRWDQRCQYESASVTVWNTEYTQSGDCRFLAYIPPMMEKSALAVKGGGCTPTSFQLITISTKFLRGQIHSLYLISTLYVLCGLEVSQGISTTNWRVH
jgi:hypothetical protein